MSYSIAKEERFLVSAGFVVTARPTWDHNNVVCGLLVEHPSFPGKEAYLTSSYDVDSVLRMLDHMMRDK